MIIKICLILLVAVFVIMTASVADAFVLNNSRPQAVTSGPAVIGGLSFNSQGSLPTFDQTLDQPGYGYKSFAASQRLISTNSKFYTGTRFGRLQTFDYSTDENLDPVETPEPASLILFGAGLAGAAIYRRYKK